MSKGKASGCLSGSDEDNPYVREQKFSEFLQKKRNERREQNLKCKELLKQNETPEEKRLRRLKKREEKDRRMKSRLGWDNEYMHYTNEDNPFGDSSLLEAFRWDKKLELQGMSNIDRSTLEKMNRKRILENRKELEKVKERRIRRDREMAERRQEMALLQSRQEMDQFRAWQKHEDQFHLEQCQLRSKIRVDEGRAKPIDLLAKYIGSVSDVDQVDVCEPYNYLIGLSLCDLEDLLTDIHVYQQLERATMEKQFWQDMIVVVEDEMSQLKRLIAQSDSANIVVQRREGVHDSVKADIASVFDGKSVKELEIMYEQIKSKLSSEGATVDVTYWESLSSFLKGHISRCRLHECHESILREKLKQLKASQGVCDTPAPTTDTACGSSRDESIDQQISEASTSHNAAQTDTEAEIAEYLSGRYSPPLIDPADLEAGTLVFDPSDDANRLDMAREMVLNQGTTIEAVGTAEERALQLEARKGMGDDEASFGVEADIGPFSYLWSDKYRPRKPRYFNRVHTGFEWNKYNQTHYDLDNPPPKVVQGYKFNIFYPDLIYKANTPEYTLTVCSDNKDFCVIRFKSGPPYEDIAFKVVNREWEFSYKHGFRCQFHNNIFQLWFHFKRYRYRR